MTAQNRPSWVGINLFAAFSLCFTFIASMHAHQSPAERVAEIQAALCAAKLDGWLFYDFRHSDPLAYRILKLDEKMLASRRWFYYVPA
jgi:Xaa-Pro aminopeptidase